MASDVERIAEVLGKAMGCQVATDQPECGWCADGYCGGHGDISYCTEHDEDRWTDYAAGPTCKYAKHVAEQLAQAGIGHVPTALRQAADAWQQGEWADTPRYPEIAQDRIAAANHVTAWLRARADRAGGDHV